MKRIILGCITMALAHGFMACSGDDASDSDSDDLQSKAVNQLTEAEVQKLCTDNLNRFKSAWGGGCTATGLIDGDGDAAKCEMLRTNCVAESPSDCSMVNTSVAADCPLAVGVLLSCLDQVIQWSAPLTCTTDTSTVPNSPECLVQLQTKCNFEMAM